MGYTTNGGFGMLEMVQNLTESDKALLGLFPENNETINSEVLSSQTGLTPKDCEETSQGLEHTGRTLKRTYGTMKNSNNQAAH